MFDTLKSVNNSFNTEKYDVTPIEKHLNFQGIFENFRWISGF